MEKSDTVYLIKCDFAWNDVGSWEAVYELSKKDKDDNALEGDVYSNNSYGTYVYSPDKFTAVVGLENVIVINTEDALLVCHRDHAQDVKHVVEHLKYHERNDLL
jgi:mannose-1-phosphate guanylyltransferase